MHCENFICINNLEEECLLDEISIDILGRCENCLYPDIDMEYLQQLKDKTLKEWAEDEDIEELTDFD